MNTRLLYRTIGALVLLVSVSGASAADMAVAGITNAEGTDIGSVTFRQAPAGVLISVDVTELPPGGHGIHLHAVGSCSPDFKASGGHVNPDGVPHGLLNPGGGDSGDLPNLHAAADGSARAEFFTTRVSLKGGDLPALLDADGSAVIIHDSPDDHTTQPIGGAGGRIACGVIEGM